MNDEPKESNEPTTVYDFKIESLKWAIFVCFVGLAMIIYPVGAVTEDDSWLYQTIMSTKFAVWKVWGRPVGIPMVFIGIASVESILWKGWLFLLLEHICTAIGWFFKRLCFCWDNFIKWVQR